MTQPVRIQLSRAKGFKLQAASLALNGLPAVKVTRPGRWGNPWKIGSRMWDEAACAFRRVETVADAILAFRNSVDWDPDAPYVVGNLICYGGFGPEHKNRKTIRAELGGKNLACFCSLDQPCHADALLEIANAGVPISGAPAHADAEVNPSTLPQAHRLSS